MTTTPAGWYDDGSGALRWWDGTQWTENVQPADAAVDEADAAAAPSGPADASAAAPAGAAVPGVPPAGYPGGYAGQGGAFIAATEPKKKSKLWIIWVVVGVVLLALVAAAAILIPMLFLNGNSLSAADKDAAVGSVHAYDEAWQEADCDKFMGATTASFRTAVSLTDCDTFVSSAQSFAESVSDYSLTVTGVTKEGEEITVATTEAYNQLLDEAGDPLETPTAYEDRFHYILVEDADSATGWAINDAFTQQSE